MMKVKVIQSSSDSVFEDLHFSNRVCNALRRRHIDTLDCLIECYAYDDIMKIRGIGRKSAIEIHNKLSLLGYEPDPYYRRVYESRNYYSYE